MKTVRAVMIGDVVGEPGLGALETRLPDIIKQHSVDFVAVNGENAADGFGMTAAAFKRIIAAGADVVTSGNHVWEKRDFWQTLETDDHILRPANYPAGSAGRGWLCVEKAGISWVIINLQGREFMTAIDCPFQSFDSILKSLSNSTARNHSLVNGCGDSAVPGIFPVIMVDFHAESSREKEALAYYIDGRAALAAGTHTHIQTADERLLPNGTAYITDLGMTGITNSVIGMDTTICLDRMRKQVLYRMEVATGAADGAAVQGVIAEINSETGKAISIKRLNAQGSTE
ncbi:MAG: YmdB family metallophosphoesterase [Treponema sp.]|jgi:calcineurin-like phosphoesterase|nr:YmdB family metallophosphoesterase [Treponema sp.]